MRRPVVIAVTAVLAAVVVVLLVLAAVLLPGLGRPAASPSGAASPAPAAIRWHACSDETLSQAHAQCATLTTPLDWSSPGDGRTIGLAISRVRHTAGPYLGVMLANPGGPGASGLALATTGAQVPDGVGARYDWIGFDPRGVGASTPRLSCIADWANGPRPPYDPATPAVISAWRARSDMYAAACGKKGGALLDHVRTTDTVADMEWIRRALGVQRISYYGYSYGTYLGQVYATLHPDRLTRMVLDSNVDPRTVWYRANLDQDAAFQTAIEAWFDWVAQHDDVYGLGSTRAAVEARYAAVHARLAARPAGGVFGSAELEDTVLYAGYSQRYWAVFAIALRQLVDGSSTLAQRLWHAFNDTADDNEYAMYLAVECTDAPWPSDWSTWQSDSERLARTAPLGTWLNTWFNAPCRTWPAKAGTPVTVDGAKAPPVLLIDETLDAATPYSGSVEVRRLFPRARLLAEPGGTSHAESLSGNACVDDTVARYLGSGTLPARRSGDGPDATCAPTPPPKAVATLG